MAVYAAQDADLQIELAGSGRPAIVLVHGGCCTRADWRAQVMALSGEHAVLTFDLRGHGQSGGDLGACNIEQWARDLNLLVDSFGLGPAVLVGHSLGARIVAEAAWQQPDNAAGLVLIDGSRTLGGQSASRPPENAVIEIHAAVRLTQVYSDIVGPFATERVRQHVVREMERHSLDLMMQCVAAYESWDRTKADRVFAELPSALPVMAIQSTYHDSFTPRHSLGGADASTPYLDFLRSALPRLDVHIVPDTGHFSMLERPEAITGLLRQFAAQVALSGEVAE